jgi:DNA-binding NarL/FixJ family response regulator
MNFERRRQGNLAEPIRIKLYRQNRDEWAIPSWMRTPVRLLVADDSETIRHAICTLLQAQTAVVVCGEAGNYAELLKIFNATTTDIVLMDVRMPGEKLFTPATIKGHLHGSCLLAMSVWKDEETASLARSYGAMKLLDKGQLASTLVPAIEECANQNGERITPR